MKGYPIRPQNNFEILATDFGPVFCAKPDPDLRALNML